MKKKKISLLELKKSKISHLNGLASLKGGTDTIPPPTEENPFTEISNCNQNTCDLVCQTYGCTNVPSCDTNDTNKTLGDPTLLNSITVTMIVTNFPC